VLAPGSARAPTLSARAGPSFEIRESVDGDGAVRLTLIGELDIAVADAVEQRLRQHREDGRPARLDLSQLDFIDSSGVQAVVLGLKRARQDGRELEVDRHVSASVQRLIEMMGIGAQLWPDAGN
jgi:anti-anti-sigma factor